MTFSRQQKKLIALGVDIIALALCVLTSFLIRFEGIIPLKHVPHLEIFVLLSIVVTIPLLKVFGIYRFSLGVVSISELIAIIKATSTSTLVSAGILFLLRDTPFISGFPRSIIILNFIFTLLVISALRIGKRILSETRLSAIKNGVRVLVIGAGGAGEELCRAMKKSTAYIIVGFVDDAEQKRYTSLHGIPILGSRADLSELVERTAPQEIIIAMPSVAARIIRETVTQCHEAGVEKIKIIPSLKEVFEGKFTLSHVRDVAIEDLLGRTPVTIDTSMISSFLKGKRVLVTGAAGSIGSTLCEQILAYHPAKLIALDKSETPLFYLERRLMTLTSASVRTFEIGSIQDTRRITQLFETYRPDVVFHAAAYKHVPLMERHPLEAIKNNIFGTLNLATAALRAGTETFVLVSTDKAVNASSIMGLTKRVCELICLAFNEQARTKFCAVRFGNVLDSQGNVIELFKSQIARGGPVEVTHPDMRRYFMITAEACLLIMEAGATTRGGEIFVLDMGEPISIVDLAHAMIRLSGYTPDVDIPVIFTGIRPGEKLFEELASEYEIPTRYEKLFITKTIKGPNDVLTLVLPRLKEALAMHDTERVIALLKTAKLHG